MKLLGSCYIGSNGLWINGLRQEEYVTEGDQWQKGIYTKLGIDYPKYHKMDALAKLAFLSFELLDKSGVVPDFKDDEVSMIFANRYSSYDTDEKFIDSYTVKGKPSPSLFVYTLPNILTGELSIRKKWYGENIFFICEKFDERFFLEQINSYFSKGVSACLCGWVDAKDGNDECFLFLVNKGDEELKDQELTNIYQQAKYE